MYSGPVEKKGEERRRCSKGRSDDSKSRYDEGNGKNERWRVERNEGREI